MTWTPQPSIRNGLNPAQRETLDRFESITQPSEWMKGQLAALTMCATDSDDRARLDAIRDKWRQAGDKS